MLHIIVDRSSDCINATSLIGSGRRGRFVAVTFLAILGIIASLLSFVVFLEKKAHYNATVRMLLMVLCISSAIYDFALINVEAEITFFSGSSVSSESAALATANYGNMCLIIKSLSRALCVSVVMLMAIYNCGGLLGINRGLSCSPYIPFIVALVVQTIMFATSQILRDAVIDYNYYLCAANLKVYKYQENSKVSLYNQITFHEAVLITSDIKVCLVSIIVLIAAGILVRRFVSRSGTDNQVPHLLMTFSATLLFVILEGPVRLFYTICSKISHSVCYWLYVSLLSEVDAVLNIVVFVVASKTFRRSLLDMMPWTNLRENQTQEVRMDDQHILVNNENELL